MNITLTQTRFASQPRRTGNFIKRAVQASATRRELRKLTPQMLADIGITRAQAEAEAKRPFWSLG